MGISSSSEQIPISLPVEPIPVVPEPEKLKLKKVRNARVVSQELSLNSRLELICPPSTCAALSALAHFAPLSDAAILDCFSFADLSTRLVLAIVSRRFSVLSRDPVSWPSLKADARILSSAFNCPAGSQCFLVSTSARVFKARSKDSHSAGRSLSISLATGHRSMPSSEPWCLFHRSFTLFPSQSFQLATHMYVRASPET